MLQSFNVSDNSATLISPSIDEGNEGMYECRGFNEFANSIVTAVIDIQSQ